MDNTKVVTLPDIGEGVVEGEVIEWLKQVGDSVAKDEPVVVVMTDKATVELPSPYSGKLSKQYYQPGEIALVDKPLYEIHTEQQNEEEPRKKEAPVVADERPASLLEGGKALATPKTRHLANELGVDLGQVPATGKQGRVTESDVVAYHASLNQKKGRAAPNIRCSTPVLHMDDDDEEPVVGLRHVIAEKMVESKYIIPHFSYFDQCDATRLIQLRESLKSKGAEEGLKVTFMPLIIKALSMTLSKFPKANSSYDLATQNIVVHKHHHIGVAVNTEQGLVVCKIENVQDKPLQQVIREYDALIVQAKQGKLTREQMTGSTITISNFGPLGGLFATPIINYPEVAILGVAKIRKQPVVYRDEIVARDMMNLSWSFDHRVIDGDGAAGISNTFMEVLKNPAQLL